MNDTVTKSWYMNRFKNSSYSRVNVHNIYQEEGEP